MEPVLFSFAEDLRHRNVECHKIDQRYLRLDCSLETVKATLLKSKSLAQTTLCWFC